MALFYQFLPPILVFVHLCFISFKGYFLPFEFSLYPYLQSHNFLPYKNIIDQHFPTIFFGPLSIPSIFTSNSNVYLIFFLLILFLTDTLFYRFLINQKFKNVSLLFATFITLSIFFSGNNFWVEIFINLFLCFWLATLNSKNSVFDFISGFLLLQVVMARPTMLISLIFLYFFFQKIRRSNIFGFAFGIALVIYQLTVQGLWTDFYELAIKFNQEIYVYLGKLYPSKRELFYILILLVPSLTNLKSKKLIPLVAAQALSLLAAYPRFDLEHLQPFALLTTISIAKSKYSNLFCATVLMFFTVINLVGLKNFRYGNYFYSPDVIEISQKIKDLRVKEITLLGANDIIYVLSQTVPPDLYYLPTLPWYLQDPSFQAKLLEGLEKNNSTILVDKLRQVDGKSIEQYFPAIIEIVSKDFETIYHDDRYYIYQKKR